MKKLVVNEVALRIAMARSGINSFAELGRTSDLHYNTIYSLLDEGKVFSSSTLDRVAAALNCDPLDLLSTVEGAADTQLMAPFGITETAFAVAA